MGIWIHQIFQLIGLPEAKLHSTLWYKAEMKLSIRVEFDQLQEEGNGQKNLIKEGIFLKGW